ncbi:MAG: hypothetical protein PHH06_00225 [Candidatus Gracilibacteria bacterium]|nr:hypothetical protein [Candidatus Gracilibacteria bacterium]
MKKNNKHAFALIIAMGLTLVMGLIAYFLLEYMVPFARNTKGIENATRAYYQAETAIEEALYFVNKQRTNYSSESGSTMSTTALGNSFSVEASGNLLPPVGKGNSEFDTDWNTISQGNPIQLDIGNNVVNSGWGSVKFYFRVPDLDKDGDNTNQTLSGGITTPLINWQLISETDALSATGSWIMADNINGDSIDFSSKNGRILNGSTDIFGNFYSNNCSGNCTLKLSIINKLELSLNNTPVPYIEWKIDFNTPVPLRYTNIETSGKSYGFKKDLEVRVPQQTVNEAFDFTVFQ